MKSWAQGRVMVVVRVGRNNREAELCFLLQRRHLVCLLCSKFTTEKHIWSLINVFQNTRYSWCEQQNMAPYFCVINPPDCIIYCKGCFIMRGLQLIICNYLIKWVCFCRSFYFVVIRCKTFKAGSPPPWCFKHVTYLNQLINSNFIIFEKLQIRLMFT